MSGPPTTGEYTRIEVDLTRNTITVTVPSSMLDPVGSPGASGEASRAGTLDIGIRGRLIGLEVGDHYVEISAPVSGTEHLGRSVAVALTAHRGRDGWATVSFSRSGDDYEISFPSGNQCWEVGRHDSGGTVRVCSVLTA